MPFPSNFLQKEREERTRATPFQSCGNNSAPQKSRHSLLPFQRAEWGKRYHRRSNLHDFSCNTSIPASKGEIRTQRKEARCSVNGEIHLEFALRKSFTEAILTEKLERQRQMPYHMHINLELLEC